MLGFEVRQGEPSAGKPGQFRCRASAQDRKGFRVSKDRRWKLALQRDRAAAGRFRRRARTAIATPADPRGWAARSFRTGALAPDPGISRFSDVQLHIIV